jgi:hypothetical protein
MEDYELEEPREQVEAAKKTRLWVLPLIVSMLLIAVGVGAFFGGISYQKGRQSNPVGVEDVAQSGRASPGQPGDVNGPMSGGGPGVMGEVTAVSSSSISVKDTKTGSSSTYSITSSTKVLNNGQAATISDIKVGDSVIVVPNTSQSGVADQIMLAPAKGGGNPPTGNATSV